MFRRWKWLGGAVVLLATHAPSLTSAFIGPDQPANAPDLKFMLANVFTTNAQHHLVISEVLREDPDIIAILELSSAMKQRWDAEDMIQAYPYRITAPQDDGNFGIGLYSRLPFLEEQIVPFNVLDIKTISATVDCSGTEYRVIATHPLPPMGARGFSLRNEHLRQLADHISEIRKSGVPLILLGDLNLTPWSPLFHDLESQTNLRRAGRGYGLAPTWYIRPVLPLGLKLDHALISDNLVCTNHKVGNDIGSDHRPVFVEVGMKSQ
ncbi:MAG: endonuclease/exonuclease/phosphatase family protein [Planctomycetaceae bacterium]